MDNNSNPYNSPRSDVTLATKDTKLPFFKSWLIFYFIVTVGGGILGAAIGGVIGIIMNNAGLSIEIIKLTAGAVGFVLGLPISYFTFTWSVSKFIIGHQTIVEVVDRSHA